MGKVERKWMKLKAAFLKFKILWVSGLSKHFLDDSLVEFWVTLTVIKGNLSNVSPNPHVYEIIDCENCNGNT